MIDEMIEFGNGMIKIPIVQDREKVKCITMDVCCDECLKMKILNGLKRILINLT